MKDNFFFLSPRGLFNSAVVSSIPEEPEKETTGQPRTVRIRRQSREQQSLPEEDEEKTKNKIGPRSDVQGNKRKKLGRNLQEKIIF